MLPVFLGKTITKNPIIFIYIKKGVTCAVSTLKNSRIVFVEKLTTINEKMRKIINFELCPIIEVW